MVLFEESISSKDSTMGRDLEARAGRDLVAPVVHVTNSKVRDELPE